MAASADRQPTVVARPAPIREVRNNVIQWREAAAKASNNPPVSVPVKPDHLSFTTRGENIILALLGVAAVCIYAATKAGLL